MSKLQGGDAFCVTAFAFFCRLVIWALQPSFARLIERARAVFRASSPQLAFVRHKAESGKNGFAIIGTNLEASARELTGNACMAELSLVAFSSPGILIALTPSESW